MTVSVDVSRWRGGGSTGVANFLKEVAAGRGIV